ncbi:MAG TPA: tyrosine-type recombinase/integrase [bacterium]|nr:tyrosine-type recombinase/integrase [bacterium]HOL48154.1 tyrosine-type recombinase/integrase [bacterium]HPQ18490.1 tyrosine-type recombinase/integrase [bacterium]
MQKIKIIVYLAENKQSATSTLNQTYLRVSHRQSINAQKFYYGTMQKRKFIYDIKRLHKDKKQPVVLSKEEVAKIFSSVDNVKLKAILILVFFAGLMVREVIKLKIEDINSEKMLIPIKVSKGRKNRYIMLSETALKILRKHWQLFKPGKWLFEGVRDRRYISTRAVEKILEQSCEKDNFLKESSVHFIGHSLDTHLLEGGTDLRYLQNLLDNKDSKTTEIYTNVNSKSIGKIKSFRHFKSKRK